MTATIDVRGVGGLARSDPHERLDDYRWALQEWLARDDFDRLIFVENSGYPLDSLRALADASAMAGDSIEFLSFDGQAFPRHLGKGYGENVNLEYVLGHSRLLSSDSLVVRVNGRNYVENIGAFFGALRPPTEILCDFKQSLTWGDGRVLGGTVDFFEKYVVPYGREVDDSSGYNFEHALARAIHRAIADGLAWSPFPEPPLIKGVSGTSNDGYGDGFLKRKGRAAQHRMKLRMLRL